MAPQDKFNIEYEKLRIALIKARIITSEIVKNVKETIDIIDRVKAVFLMTVLGSYSICLI